jgi:hypothetical protein
MTLLRWLIFNVLISLLPLAFAAFLLASKQAPHQESMWVSVLGGGELLLISTAIAAEAIGDLIASNEEKAVWKYISSGGCLIALIFSALWYATVRESGPTQNAATIVVGSVILFAATFVAALSCKFLARE